MFLPKLHSGLLTRKVKAKKKIELTLDVTPRNIPGGVVELVKVNRLTYEEIRDILLAKQPEKHEAQLDIDHELKELEQLWQEIKTKHLTDNIFDMINLDLKEVTEFTLENHFQTDLPNIIQGSNNDIVRLLGIKKGQPHSLQDALLILMQLNEKFYEQGDEFTKRTTDVLMDALDKIVEFCIGRDIYYFEAKDLKNKMIFGKATSISIIGHSVKLGAIGFLNEKFGLTSHSAIEAHSSGTLFAKYTGVGQLLKTGDKVIFDNSTIIVNPTQKDLNIHYEKQVKQAEDKNIPLLTTAELLSLQPKTTDLEKINISGKITHGTEYKKELFKIYSIGLYITEHNYKLDIKYTQHYLTICNNHPKQVVIRMFDYAAEKINNFDKNITEKLNAELNLDETKRKNRFGLKFSLYTNIGQKIFYDQAREFQETLAKTSNPDVYFVFAMVESVEDYLEAKKRLIGFGIPENRIGLTVEDKNICTESALNKMQPAIILAGGSDLVVSCAGVARNELNIFYESLKNKDFLKCCQTIVNYGQKAYGQDYAQKVIFCGEAATYHLFYKILIGLGYRNFALPLLPEGIGTNIIFTRYISVDDCQKTAKLLMQNQVDNNFINVLNSPVQNKALICANLVDGIKLRTLELYYEQENEDVISRVNESVYNNLKVIRRNILHDYDKTAGKIDIREILFQAKYLDELARLVQGLWSYSDLKAYRVNYKGSKIDIDGFKEDLSALSKQEIIEVAKIFLTKKEKNKLVFLNKKATSKKDLENVEAFRQIALFSEDKKPLILAIKNMEYFYQYIESAENSKEAYYSNYLEALHQKYKKDYPKEYFNSEIFIHLPALDQPGRLILMGFSNRKKSILEKRERNVWPRGLYKERIKNHGLFYMKITQLINKYINDMLEILDEHQGGKK